VLGAYKVNAASFSVTLFMTRIIFPYALVNGWGCHCHLSAVAHASGCRGIGWEQRWYEPALLLRGQQPRRADANED
jgi:hypothetical protein